MSTLDRSYLVQRLEKPTRPTVFGQDNPFAFGGGLRNGGLSDDAMAALRGIFSFAYMGSAEFEWGAVPQALSGLAKDAKSLVAFEFEVDLADVPPNWRDRGQRGITGTALLYGLSRRDHEAEVRERVVGWSHEQYPRLKESLHLVQTLRPHDEWDGETVGWLELDNGFFFFTDRVMWEQTSALFGVKVPERAS